MNTFSKGNIVISEIAKRGKRDPTPNPSPTRGGEYGGDKKKTAELRSGAVVIENFKTFYKLQVKKPVFEN